MGGFFPEMYMEMALIILMLTESMKQKSGYINFRVRMNPYSNPQGGRKQVMSNKNDWIIFIV
jgi:hypothetical protein